MPRRDGGGVSVSTAMESQQKGSTPPGIHFALYDRRLLLTTQLGEATATERDASLSRNRAMQGSLWLVVVYFCCHILLLSLFVEHNGRSFALSLTNQPECCRRCSRVNRISATGRYVGQQSLDRAE